MIVVYPDGWIGNAILLSMAIATVAVSAFVAGHWGRKAWIWGALSGLLCPAAVFVGWALVFNLTDTPGGGVVHVNLMVLALGIPCALAGFSAGLWWQSRRVSVH